MINYSTAATIYISQNDGDDTYSGLLPEYDGGVHGPLKSVSRALELIGGIRTAQSFQPISVQFKGDYYLERSIDIGAQFLKGIYDTQNTVIRDITFESYGDTRSRLIGGKRITGFEKDRFNGEDCFSVYIPDVKEKGMRFSDLYTDKKVLNISRYPKEGELKAVATEYDDSAFGLMKGSRWFIAHKEDLEDIPDIENAGISFFHWWIDEHAQVESYDKETGKLIMNARSCYTMTADYTGKCGHIDIYYHLENVAKGFGNDDSWYLDCETGKLYYKPADMSVKAEEIEVYAPTLTELVRVSGTPENKVSGIRFKNLDFMCSKGDYLCKMPNCVDGTLEPHAACGQSHSKGVSAVKFNYAENCSVRNCKTYCLGFHAIEIGKGSDSVRIEECEMFELGGSGIKMLGNTATEPETDACRHNTVRRNYIHHPARRYRAACGIIAMHTSHNEISENEICFLDYSGLSLGWVWGYRPSNTRCNLIRGNHIHHVGGGQISDLGAIYTLGKQDGTVIEENLLHDVYSRFYGAHAIHSDEGTCYILYENNTVYEAKQNCYHLHFGTGNVLRNNVFGFANEALIRTSRYEGTTSVIFENNDFITDGHPVYHFENSDGVFTHMPNMSAAAHRNRIWDVSGETPIMSRCRGIITDFNTWQDLYGLEEGSTVGKADDIISEGRTVSRREKEK